MSHRYLTEEQFQKVLNLCASDPEPTVYYESYKTAFRNCNRVKTADDISIGVWNNNHKIAMAVFVEEDLALIDEGWINMAAEGIRFPTFSEIAPDSPDEGDIILLTGSQKMCYIDHIKLLYEIASL